ncbi:helix-turn-helix domain-containing protein [Corynebacterium uterequi]|uniref:CENP-B N-terminal DNA-binding domain n=1 Tax=Corynebacterium uterequi TaxID=1072256 RepID=A0A0G3HCI9_9CORY|nr:hypothetical protein [Corynebacterium uterequi]AKK10420.1 CENP-B N-terminal DNA-binding domain [Corynebacterium uterequi]
MSGYSGLTADIAIQLLESGESQAAIAREFGVTQQYVSKILKGAGYVYVTPSKFVAENMPWDVPTEWRNATIHNSIRLMAFWNMDHELIKGEAVGKLSRFLNKLIVFNQVVDFNLNYPPIKGLNSKPGFAYVPRTPEDEGMAIKIRPGIRLTAEGRKLWAMPKELPEGI